MKFYYFLLYATIILFQSCMDGDHQVLSSLKDNSQAKLDDYWYQGKAEITSYSLIQNRYQNEHQGHAVMIFVTEDFLIDKQVKNDTYSSANYTNVLKNNRIRRFTTGLYDYSMMTSTFTPVDRKAFPHSLKVTMSSQDWCGQSYQQINEEENKYRSTLHSYFEKEADKVSYEDLVFLEDELFTILRIHPDLLPTGEIEVIPSLEFLRLKHLPFEKIKAVGHISDYSGNEFEGQGLREYELNYMDNKRKLSIIFEQEKPYKIMGWKETYPSVFDNKMRTTVAKHNKEIFQPYWEMNSLKDSVMRAELGL